ncbi:9453_t:CDS:2, partial [Rhizophagus irregularis]
DGKLYENIRKWLLEQLVAIGCDSGEIALYQFLCDTYPDALKAIMLKAKMLRIDFEGRKKSASMILRARVPIRHPTDNHILTVVRSFN